jgi:hypothetical protein
MKKLHASNLIIVGGKRMTNRGGYRKTKNRKAPNADYFREEYGRNLGSEYNKANKAQQIKEH